MNKFKIRVIELTSEKITLEKDYMEFKNVVKNMSYSDRTRTRLAKRLIKKKQALDHLEKNLQTNIYLSNKVE